MSEIYRPRWSELLAEAVNRRGLILEAYSWFHKFSVGNQIAALTQCRARSIEPGPIASFRRWLELGRHVKRGEKALTLCMPVTVTRKVDSSEAEDPPEPHRQTIFVWKPHWFVLSQTEGRPYEAEPLPDWSKERALSVLGIAEMPFTITDGNVQGYTEGRRIATNPIAKLPWKTLFHELGHVLLGHTAQADDEQLQKTVCEAEAEAVALLCCDSLSLPGADFCRGYIQEWLGAGNPFPEPSAKKILRTADQILKAGAAPTGTRADESRRDEGTSS